MAFELAIKANGGFDCPVSYWVPVQRNVCFADKNAAITFYGYKDRDAYEAGEASIGSKQINLSGDEFDTWQDKPLSKPVADLKEAEKLTAYEYAKSAKTVDKGEDEEGKPILVSQFDGAKDV